MLSNLFSYKVSALNYLQVYAFRWQPIPQRRKMLTPQGQKTESGNTAALEKEIGNHHLNANGVDLENAIAQNRSKGIPMLIGTVILNCWIADSL